MTSLVNRILCRVSLSLITAAAVTTAAAQQSEIGPTTDAQVQSQNKTKIALIVSPKGSVLSEAAAPIQQGILAASREATASGACELVQYELSNPQDAGADTIRGKYSDDSYEKASAAVRLVNNVIHASDSHESAQRELNIWKSYLK